MERRKLLKNAIAVVAGIVSNEAIIPVKIATAAKLEEHTNLKNGNANYVEFLKDECEKNGFNDLNECIKQLKLSNFDQIDAIVIGPLFEEFFMRKIPSELIGEEAHEGILQKNWLLSRREVIGGLLTSTIFALMHNITSKGIKTEYLHATSFVSGCNYWYLQRKFGFRTNFIAHLANNYKAIKH